MSSALPRPLRLFQFLVLALTTATWAAWLIGRLLHLHAPYLYPLVAYVPGFPKLWDLRMYFFRFQKLHTAAFFTDPGLPFVYFAPGVFLYPPLYEFGNRGSIFAYLAVTGVAILAGCVLLRRAMLRSGRSMMPATSFLFIAVITSYPLLFTLERGNLEMMVAIGLAAGTWAYWRGHPWWAVILWALFGSVKLYPLMLAGVFARRGQWLRLFAMGAIALSANLLSTLYIGPTFADAFRGLQAGTRVFLHLVPLGFWAIGFDHSVFALLKLLTLQIHPSLAKLLTYYLVFATVLMLVLFFAVVRKRPAANQLLFLSIASIVLPPASFDYTLIQLYAPWAILVALAVRASAENRPVRGLSEAFVLFSFIFTPTNFLVVHQYAYSAQVKCVLLLALMVLSAMLPLDPAEAPTFAGQRPDGIHGKHSLAGSSH